MNKEQPTITHNDKKDLIPELRFSDFGTNSIWHEKKLKDFCFNISSGKDKNCDDGKFNLYGSTGIIGKSKIASYEGFYILVARVGANAGTLNMAIGKFGVTDNTLVINLKNSKQIKFIYYLLINFGLNKLVFGSGQPLVTGRQLKELSLPIPKNQQEQQKIASCLSSLDDIINAETEKLDLLQDHKKGLLQQLFPQQGESKPKYRFPEFKDDGDWKFYTLKNIVNIKKGKQLNRSELTAVGKYPCQNGGISPSGYTNKYNTIENTITISEGGNSCGYINFMTSKFWCGGHCYSLLDIKDIFNNIFLYQLLKANEYLIMRLRVGSGLPNIQKRDIEKFQISVPHNLKEQQKIAECLSSVDELIASQQQKIEGLKAHKKGLLQQLFPKI